MVALSGRRLSNQTATMSTPCGSFPGTNGSDSESGRAWGDVGQSASYRKSGVPERLAYQRPTSSPYPGVEGAQGHASPLAHGGRTAPSRAFRRPGRVGLELQTGAQHLEQFQ